MLLSCSQPIGRVDFPCFAYHFLLAVTFLLPKLIFISVAWKNGKFLGFSVLDLTLSLFLQILEVAIHEMRGDNHPRCAGDGREQRAEGVGAAGADGIREEGDDPSSAVVTQEVAGEPAEEGSHAGDSATEAENCGREEEK